MARPATTFVCSDCGHAEARWRGQCPGCEAWNTLVEERVPAASRAAGAGRANGRGGAVAPRPVPLREVRAERTPRLSTGVGELDRVLGGGLVPGSLVLLGGSPGIGKSTLTGMALGHLVGAGRRVMYVSGEESAAQIRLRHERLARGAAPAALDVPVLAETDLDAVLAALEAERPEACVIDSVQTLHASELSGAPGSVGQVREVAARIMEVAKRSGTAVVLVGHVTKEGSLAGPRVLEHLVDCVVQFEGERERTYRTIRALKNRFGSTSEVGVFEMRDGGLVEVLDASARFVAEATRAPGSVVLASMEGSRPLLVEVQALVSPSELVPPRRVGHRDRPQPPRARARGPRPPRRDRRGDGRRVRQRRRRRAARRAGRRPRRRARGRQRGARPSRRGRRRAAGVLRRGRPHGRAALGRPSRPARRRGREVRPADARDPGVRADAAPGRPRGPGPRARAGAGSRRVARTRGGQQSPMVFRAVAPVLLAFLVLAAPAAAQDQAVQDAVTSLRSDEVYVDPASRSILPADQERRVEREIAARRPGPVYIAVLPAEAARAGGGSAAGVAAEIARGLGRPGIYVVTVGTDLQAGQLGRQLDRGEPAKLARDAISDHQSDPPRARLGAILTDYVGRVAAARANGGSAPGSGGGGGGGAGTGTLALLAVLAGAGGLFAVSRARRRRREEAAQVEDLRTAARDDLVALGDDVRAIDVPIEQRDADPRAREALGVALERYDQAETALDRARRPEDFAPITQALEEGRYEMEVAKSRLEGREPPERRPPCFFDPRHGPSVEDVEWTPPGGQPRLVPACQADAVRIAEGLEPTSREVMVGGHADAVLRGAGVLRPLGRRLLRRLRRRPAARDAARHGPRRLALRRRCGLGERVRRRLRRRRRGRRRRLGRRGRRRRLGRRRLGRRGLRRRRRLRRRRGLRRRRRLRLT